MPSKPDLLLIGTLGICAGVWFQLLWLVFNA